jgi:DNA-binding response OmpR family regulator
MNVLVVEDDADHLDLLTYALRREGFNVSSAVDGTQAVEKWQETRPDMVLMDANIPKLNGLEVCRKIRHEGRTPVIMVTARDEEEDVMRAFRYGADDYVVKPFSVKQLVARMKAVLGRTNAEPFKQTSGELMIGNVVLDLQSHVAKRDGVEVQLTRLEFRIFSMLAANPGRVIPYSRLVEYAWGYDGGDSSLLKTHICHIREKLPLSDRKDRGIRSVPGVGYSIALGA